MASMQLERHTELHDDESQDCNSYDQMGKPRYPRDLSPRSREQARLQVNQRERERMHDINGALDALRQVMPYGNGPSVKKLSKLSTLLLARNYIVTLSKTLEELRLCVTKVSMEQKAMHPGTLPPRDPVLGTMPGLYPGVHLSSASQRAALYRTLTPSRDTGLLMTQTPSDISKSPRINHGSSKVTSPVTHSPKLKCAASSKKSCFCVECLTRK